MLLGRRLAFRAQVRSAIAPQIFICYLFARSPVWSSTVKGQPSPPGESYRLGQLPSFPVGGFQRLLNRAIPIGSIVVPFWGSYLESYKVFPRRNYYGAYGYPDETRNYTPRAEKSPQTGSPKLISRREKSLISFSKRVEQGALCWYPVHIRQTFGQCCSELLREHPTIETIWGFGCTTRCGHDVIQSYGQAAKCSCNAHLLRHRHEAPVEHK